MIKNKKGFTLIEIIIVISIIGIFSSLFVPNIIKSSDLYQRKSFYDRVKVIYSASMFSYIELKETSSIPALPTANVNPNCILFNHIYRNLGENLKEKHVHSDIWADQNATVASPSLNDTRTHCMLNLGDAFATLVQIGAYQRYSTTPPSLADLEKYEEVMYLQIYIQSDKYKALYPAPLINDSAEGVVIDIAKPNPTWWAYGVE